MASAVPVHQRPVAGQVVCHTFMSICTCMQVVCAGEKQGGRDGEGEKRVQRTWSRRDGQWESRARSLPYSRARPARCGRAALAAVRRPGALLFHFGRMRR